MRFFSRAGYYEVESFNQQETQNSSFFQSALASFKKNSHISEQKKRSAVTEITVVNEDTHVTTIEAPGVDKTSFLNRVVKFRSECQDLKLKAEVRFDSKDPSLSDINNMGCTISYSDGNEAIKLLIYTHFMEKPLKKADAENISLPRPAWK